MFDDSFKARYTTLPFAVYSHGPHPQSTSFVAHNHKELELIAMTGGTAEFYLDTAQYSLSANDLLLIPPYCIHYAKIAPNATYDCACFDLSILCDRALSEGLTEGRLAIPSPLCTPTTNTEPLHAYATEAIRAFCEGGTGWELAVAGQLSLLFSKLKARGFFTEQKSSTRGDRFCRTVIEYVAAHYADEITSATAARELYINNSYFCRLFKSNFGCSFSAFLTAYRLEKAKLMLSEHGRSISDIAMCCGFHSFSYFCKTFRDAFGLSPTSYRTAAGAPTVKDEMPPYGG